MTEATATKSASICEAFVLLAELATKDGISSINQFEGCWERKIGDQWFVAINGQRSAIPCSRNATPIQPYHAYVEFNGWPCGVFTPYGGAFVVGAAANEDHFIKAIEAEIARK